MAAAVQQQSAGEQGGEGLYCSTAGEYFISKDDLADHYRSEFHRYNLKRKIAGLPPVTREWYDARREQLAATSTTSAQRVWFDPLSRKKFYTENTFLAFTRSKKYQDLVKKSGGPAPAPIVTLRQVEEAQQGGAAPKQPQQAQQPQQTQAHVQRGEAEGVGFVVKAVARGPAPQREAGGDGEEVDEGSDWETASEEEMGSDQQWEEWDVRRSLLDGRLAGSMEENLDYMYRNYGFYLPDAEYLSDPEGMLKYLGAKLQYGHVALYDSGDNPNARQFASLHAVQRHMVDSNRCKVLYEDNEDEYEQFYDYSSLDEREGMEEDCAEGTAAAGSSGAGTLMVGAPEVAGPSAAYELVLSAPGGGSRILGAREFARYYRQRHRGGDGRMSVVTARAVQAQYRKLAVPLLEGPAPEVKQQRRMERATQRRAERSRQLMGMRRNFNDNNPKNVPY